MWKKVLDSCGLASVPSLFVGFFSKSADTRNETIASLREEVQALRGFLRVRDEQNAKLQEALTAMTEARAHAVAYRKPRQAEDPTKEKEPAIPRSPQEFQSYAYEVPKHEILAAAKRFEKFENDEQVEKAFES